ncbi:hypothetical protein Cgig2_024124 [Carnegiea gigantea]|uniref:Uncharacterized protein n=1 Tax=Carnegiea gigantea TaxID=171969 RepID=A0A9Q1Q795_9CARY|nr:hypothetical protein Cgig2_024124 [Carnegiea gigantea]
MKIFPRGKEFYPNHTHVIHALSNIMRSKFDSPYHTWKEIPIEVRNMWFDKFKKKFCWDDEHAHEIRRVFEFRASSRLKGMTFEIRKSGKQPVWLSKDVYDGLCAYWESEEFKGKSMRKNYKESQLLMNHFHSPTLGEKINHLSIKSQKRHIGSNGEDEDGDEDEDEDEDDDDDDDDDDDSNDDQQENEDADKNDK